MGARGAAPDWMEWQANYAAGAMLMPAARMRALVPQSVWQRAAGPVLRRLSAEFAVSQQAATIRLQQLGLLSVRPPAVARSPVPRLGRSS